MQRKHFIRLAKYFIMLLANGATLHFGICSLLPGAGY